MDLAESHARIARWIAEADPLGAAPFNRPATEAQISAAEARLGMVFPASIRNLYRLADGQPRDAVCLADAFNMMALEEVVEAADFLNDAFPGGINGEDPDHAPMDVDMGIRATWWWPRWIPMMTNGSGDYLCLDLDPADGGTVGQIISYYHDETYRRREASGMDALLAKIADMLSAGGYVIEEGMIEQKRA